MDNALSNNQAVIIGTIEGEFSLNHEIYAEKFYTFTVKIPRLSGAFDSIRVMVSERLIMDSEYHDGDKVEITGQFRSYNSYENGENRLLLIYVCAAMIAARIPIPCTSTGIYARRRCTVQRRSAGR